MTSEDFQRLLTSEARFAPTPEVLAQALYDEVARHRIGTSDVESAFQNSLR